MKLTTIVSTLLCCVAPLVYAQQGAGISVERAGSHASIKGAAANFTGNVRVDPLFKRSASGRASGALVTFDPAARTAWHSHPLGQTLIVTAGAGRVQHWKGPIQEIRPGDVVWIPPGVKHWHGAGATTGMAHIAIVEADKGKTADWMEHVSEEQPKPAAQSAH